MASKGGQPGNKNAGSSAEKAPWKAAINRALAQDDGKRLRKAAETLLDLAAAGEQWAVKELGERLDGKVAQIIAGPDGGPVQLEMVPWLRERSV